MTERYFIDEPIVVGRTMLAGPEAHHLIHVMRATPGTRVVLFDGHGAEFPAIVQRVGRSDVELSVVSREEIDRESSVEVTLGVALPKGDRQKWLVEKAVELGVTRIVPLRTERGVAQPVEQALQRLRRSVVEASKQCGRNRLLRIDEPQGWSDFVEAAAEVPCRFLAHPQGFHKYGPFAFRKQTDVKIEEEEKASPASLKAAANAAESSTSEASQPVASSHLPDRVILAIGPEGGFTGEEVCRSDRRRLAHHRPRAAHPSCRKRRHWCWQR